MSPSSPKATVIMRSKNSQETIGQALAALFSQTYRDFELMVVDSGSTDGTLDIVAKYPCRLVRIEPKSYFPGSVLNQAILETATELIVMQNSDSVPLTPHALARLLAVFEEPQVQAAFARQLPRPDAVPWVRRDYASSFPPVAPAPQWLTMSFPLAAMRRSAWEEHPFYTDAWASEDTEWGNWIRSRGYEIRYVPDSLVMHSHNYTLAQIYGRRFVEGEADAFIYGGADTLPGMLAKMATSIARDLWFHARIGAFREMSIMPIRRAAYYWAYHQGHKLGERRIAQGDTDTSKGQTIVLERHDAK
jgi:rhamnosyltransferase